MTETLNYDKKYWEKPCPRIKCRKDPCACGLRYVNIPASLEDEAVPKNGLYSNAIVEYSGSGRVYIYSAEGVPVLIKDGDSA